MATVVVRAVFRTKQRTPEIKSAHGTMVFDLAGPGTRLGPSWWWSGPINYDSWTPGLHPQ